MAPPTELSRVVADGAGGLAEGRTLAGRGAWVCRDSVVCIDAADRRRAFTRALRTEVSPDAVAALRASAARRGRMVGEESGL